MKNPVRILLGIIFNLWINSGAVVIFIKLSIYVHDIAIYLGLIISSNKFL